MSIVLLTLWQKFQTSRPMWTSEGTRRSTLNLAEWWTLRKIESGLRGSRLSLNNLSSLHLFICNVHGHSVTSGFSFNILDFFFSQLFLFEIQEATSTTLEVDGVISRGLLVLDSSKLHRWYTPLFFSELMFAIKQVPSLNLCYYYESRFSVFIFRA